MKTKLINYLTTHFNQLKVTKRSWVFKFLKPIETMANLKDVENLLNISKNCFRDDDVAKFINQEKKSVTLTDSYDFVTITNTAF